MTEGDISYDYGMARSSISIAILVAVGAVGLLGCGSPWSSNDARSDGERDVAVVSDVPFDQGAFDVHERDGSADVVDPGVDPGVDTGVDPGVDTGVDPDVDAGVCATGAVLMGVCVAIRPPRPVWPLSLGDATQRRPTLRWSLPVGVDGAVVELCRDRGCSVVLQTLRVVGTSARPSADLPARSVIFWRLRGRVGSVEGVTSSATWLFRTPLVSAPAAIDTASHAHFDVNGDGYDDLAAAAIGARLTRSVGIVYIHHGGSSGIDARVATRLLPPTADFGFFAAAISGAGDVNGDGFADLIVGNGFAADSERLYERGVAHLYFGGPAGVSTAPAWSVTGAAAAEKLGTSVSSAGDVDRDGYGDVIVGIPGRAVGDSWSAGAWQLFRGSPSGLLADAIVLGGGPVLELGYSVASAGDVNGDGFNDVIVGARSTVVRDRTNSGAAFVHHGSAAGIEATPRTRLDGAPDAWFGNTVQLAGDVNNDGYSDVMVSAPDHSPFLRTNAGSVFVYHGGASGLSAAVQRQFDGEALDRLGETMVGAADFDADGFADVALGNSYPSESPTGRPPVVRVVRGSATGLAPTPARTLSIADRRRYFGQALLGGDVNGDGVSDLVVGARDFGDNAGAAFVFHGSALGIGASETLRINGAPREAFATRIAH